MTTTTTPVRFAPFLDLAPRTEKPRKRGITMVADRGWPLSFVEGTLDGLAPYMDIAKISAWHIHQPEEIVRQKIELYRRHGVEPQVGGPILEIARAQGKDREILEYLRDIGFEGLEISAEAMPTQAAAEEEIAFAELCQEMGFRIHGEVGKKFPEGDQTRRGAREIDVDETVRQFELYLDHGAENVYWEGHLLRMVLGDNGEREEGRASVEEVAHRVGLDNIIFEVPFTYLPYASKRALQGLLVYMFGPDVNIGNVLIEEVTELEEIRGGTFPAFGVPSGDHPWLASLYRNGQTASPEWWKGK